MSALSHTKFVSTLPDVVRPLLPVALQGFQVRRPWSILQFHYGEPSLHYEVSSVGQRPGRLVTGWELGFHCEARDQHLNRLLLNGFRRHLFEIKTTLGEGVEAEMWDRGWTKIYEVYPGETMTVAYQAAVAARIAEIITCLHPVFVDLRQSAAELYR